MYYFVAALFIILLLLFIFFLKVYSKKKKIWWYTEELSEEEQYEIYKKDKELLRRRQLQIMRQRDAGLQKFDLQQESSIVGFIEPVGRWTRMVMNQYLPKITMMKNADNKRGFWQIRVTMAGKSQGKHQGRSR